MAGLVVENWDVRFNSLADATVGLDADVKLDRGMKLFLADGGVVQERLGDRARSLHANVLRIKIASVGQSDYFIYDARTARKQWWFDAN
jgi:hypothetical protein